MNVLAASDLTLEPQTAGHAEAMFLVLGDPAIYEYENEPPPSPEWLRHRYSQLESRKSPDGSEHWLNWVVRLPDSRLAGYVQATVNSDGHSDIAYVFASEFWGRGYASTSVEAMIAELRRSYGVHTLWAVLKESNRRSRRLLERIGFAPACHDDRRIRGLPADEALMVRQAADG